MEVNTEGISVLLPQINPLPAVHNSVVAAELDLFDRTYPMVHTECFLFFHPHRVRDLQSDLGCDCKDTLPTYPRVAVSFRFDGWCVALCVITCNGRRRRQSV